jgi:hypothetical protein
MIHLAAKDDESENEKDDCTVAFSIIKAKKTDINFRDPCLTQLKYARKTIFVTQKPLIWIFFRFLQENFSAKTSTCTI